MSPGAELARLRLIQPFESCAKRGKDGLIYPYLDAIGIPTQGWGIVVSGLDVPPITQDEADRRLLVKIEQFEREVAHIWSGYWFAPTQVQAAVLSWVYNLGAGAFKASTFLRRLRTGDWHGAAAECRKWNKAGGRVLAGLTARRNTEAAMIEGAAA